jgi:Pregnancy-associated plasma protein-A
MRPYAPLCALMRPYAPLCALMRPYAPLCALMRPYAPLCALIVLMQFFSNTLTGQVNKLPKCGSGLDMKTIRSNPALLEQYNKIEKQVLEYKRLYGTPNSNQRIIDPNGVITIPVVVHIIHGIGQNVGTGTNLSYAQVQSQIDVLNEDFSRTNPDAGQTPSILSGLASNPMFVFRLACFDPDGISTDGITRTPSVVDEFPLESSVKSNGSGGKNPWPADRYLNIWVVKSIIDPDLLGIAQDIMFLNSNPNTDGIIVRADCFGRGSTYNLRASNNKGRTLTHEVGHWLNLIHIWGPSNGRNTPHTCSDSDECNDTPNQLGPNFDVPTFPNTASCGNSGDMFMNFMDYTDDVAMNLFTNDQRARMRSVFMTGGARASFIDNYFKITAGPQSCSIGAFRVKTPFCEAQNNIQWSITGGGSFFGGTNGITQFVLFPNYVTTITLTATWGNYISDFVIPVSAYGIESSTYTTYDNYSYGSPVLTLRNGGFYSAKTNTYGTVSFSGANGVAKNWRIFSQSGQAYLNGYGNNFSLNVYPNSNVTIRADIPTTCGGDKMVQYTFYRSGYQYALSPNPASNNITITALNVSADPNARTTSEMPEYEVQIFTRYNQLMKKTKCPKGSKDITIDVSNLPSNQLYTVQFISSEDVQTKSFFKE